MATTCEANCFLGMQVYPKADQASLEIGYAIFKEKAADLNPDYQPTTVNTDGWWATQNTW